jgi:hypothetical protein
MSKRSIKLTEEEIPKSEVKTTFIQCQSARDKNQGIYTEITSSAGKYICKLTVGDFSVEFEEMFYFSNKPLTVTLEPLAIADHFLLGDGIKRLLEELLLQSAEVIFDASDELGRMNIELKSPVINRTLNISMEYKDALPFAIPLNERTREYFQIPG